MYHRLVSQVQGIQLCYESPRLIYRRPSNRYGNCYDKQQYPGVLILVLMIITNHSNVRGIIIRIAAKSSSPWVGSKFLRITQLATLVIIGRDSVNNIVIIHYNNIATNGDFEESSRFSQVQYEESKTPTSRVSCQKGPTRYAYAWQIGIFWQDTLGINID